MSAAPDYRGRFAPSPTGPLHFGSLIAAVGSYLHARSRGGIWQVRIDDLDPPREMAGAGDRILQALERYGFAWDGPVFYQHGRDAHYEAALQRLAADGHTYACRCSRREIVAIARSGRCGPVYPGTCRRSAHPADDAAIRVHTGATAIRFTDGLCGEVSCDLAAEVGDFVIRRADGLFAYQLAVVVDDDAQGITDIVRGADLLDVTPGQLLLYDLLGLARPRYLHLPVAVGSDGGKLSKQRGAAPLPLDDPRPMLLHALALLGQQPPAGLRDDTLDGLWAWALQHWDEERLPVAREVAATGS